MSYNGAAFMDAKENDEIMQILSAFQRCTNIALDVKPSTFECGGFYDPIYEGKQTGFIINGKEFRKEPCIETWKGYVARIKGYLFDMMITR